MVSLINGSIVFCFTVALSLITWIPVRVRKWHIVSLQYPQITTLESNMSVKRIVILGQAAIASISSILSED
jgi:hypothetical protein